MSYTHILVAVAVTPEVTSYWLSGLYRPPCSGESKPDYSRFRSRTV